MKALNCISIGCLVTLGMIGTEARTLSDELYGLDSGKTLVSIDTTTGEATAIGVGDYQDAFGGFGVGLAYHPGSDTMYSRSFDNLYTVDLSDGSTSLIGPSPGFLTGLTFDSVFSTLYSVGQGTGDFAMVHPATGDPIIIGNTGQATPLGLTTRSDGTVFMSTIAGDLFSIDELTGAATLVASGVGGGLTEIAFDSNDVLYGVTLSGDFLGTIDTDTGSFNTIGTVGFTDIRGLTFVSEGLTLEITNSCPASGPATLTATGGSGGTIGFVYTLNGAGSFTIPGGFTCAGTELGLNPPVVLGGSATGNPAVVNVPNAPAIACGTVFVQAIDATTCQTSNVVAF